MNKPNTTVCIDGTEMPDVKDVNLEFDEPDLTYPDDDELPRHTRRQFEISTETDTDRLMSRLDSIESKRDRLLDELDD